MSHGTKSQDGYHAITEFERKLNSSLPLGHVALKFCCPGQVLVCSFKDLVDRWLADPLPIEQVNEKLLAQKENLLFPDDRTALFLSAK